MISQPELEDQDLSPLNSKDFPAEGSSEPSPGTEPVKEIGGRGGADPTRYGDWEKNGRCIDF